jgi:hypothetical protein
MSHGAVALPTRHALNLENDPQGIRSGPLEPESSPWTGGDAHYCHDTHSRPQMEGKRWLRSKGRRERLTPAGE